MNSRDGAILKLKVVATITWLALASSVRAQDAASLYFLPHVSQSSLDNPAIQNTSGKLVIGVPFLSGISGNWNANVPFNALFFNGFDYSFHKLYNSLENEGHARASAGVAMFFASFNYNDYTLSLSVKERTFSEGVADREIVRFIRDGTQSFYGTNENLGSGTFFFTHYRELAPAVSKRFFEHLDVGIRPKLLFGKFQFETEDLNFSVESDTEREQLFFKPEGTFSLSGPLSHSRDTVFGFSSFSANVSPGDYFFQPRNLGVAIDFGVVYRPNRFSELSFSFLDAGLIGFKHKSFDVEFVRSAQFSGTLPYQSHTPDASFYLEPREALIALSDSVSYLIDVEEAGLRNMTTLPLKINIAGKYKYSEKLTTGFNNQFTRYRLRPLNIFTVFLTTTLHKKFDFYGSLSFINSNSLVPGFGTVYSTNQIQIYFTSNNILGIVKPMASKQLNLSFGINLLFDTE